MVCARERVQVRGLTNLDPYTGSTLVPVSDSQEQTNDGREETVEVEGVEDRDYEHADTCDQKVNF